MYIYIHIVHIRSYNYIVGYNHDFMRQNEWISMAYNIINHMTPLRSSQKSCTNGPTALELTGLSGSIGFPLYVCWSIGSKQTGLPEFLRFSNAPSAPVLQILEGGKDHLPVDNLSKRQQRFSGQNFTCPEQRFGIRPTKKSVRNIDPLWTAVLDSLHDSSRSFGPCCPCRQALPIMYMSAIRKRYETMEKPIMLVEFPTAPVGLFSHLRKDSKRLIAP